MLGPIYLNFVYIFLLKCIDSTNDRLITEYALDKSFIYRISMKIDCKTYDIYQRLVTSHSIIYFQVITLEGSKYSAS